MAFVDGRLDAVDLIVLATGYVRGVPFVPPTVLPDDDVSSLFLNVFHRSEKGLFVVGHFTTDGGAYPILDRQAELLARRLDAFRHDRSWTRFEKALQAASPDFSGGVKYQKVRRMSNYVKSRPYKRYLDALLADVRSE